MNIGKKALAFLVTFLMLFSNGLVGIPTVSAVALSNLGPHDWDAVNSFGDGSLYFAKHDSGDSSHTVAGGEEFYSQSGPSMTYDEMGRPTITCVIIKSSTDWYEYVKSGSGWVLGGSSAGADSEYSVSVTYSGGYPTITATKISGHDISHMMFGARYYSGSFRIRKVFDGAADNSQKFTVHISGDNGVSRTLEISADQGWVTVDSLTAGTYTVTEDSENLFQKVSIANSETGDNTVIINSSGSHGDVTVTNRMVGSAKLRKIVDNVTDDGTPFKLNITGDNGYSGSVTVRETDSWVGLDNLPLGTYTVTEDDKTGYEKFGVSPNSFEITAGNRAVVAEVTATNHKLFGSVKLAKSVSNVTDDGTPFTLNVSGDNGYTGSVTVSETTGWQTLSGLPFGHYTVTEDGKDGYRNVSITPPTFDISNSTYASAVEVTAVNEKLFGSVTLHKVIDNATGDKTHFTLDITGDNGYSNTVTVGTDIPDAALTDLPVGTYTVSERTADGYSTVSISPRTFPIDSVNYAVSVAVTVTNHKQFYGKISVVKQDAANPALKLSGAEFKISTSDTAFDANIVDTMTTKADGTATSKDLPVGAYWVKETKAPGGYLIDNPNPVAVMVLANETVLMQPFTDTKQEGSLLIHKSSALNGQPVAGVQFEASTSPSFTPADTLLKLPNDGKTDANGDVFVQHLTAGTVYYVREIHQAPGYSIDPTLVKNVTIVYNETVRADFTNDPVGTVRVTKVDSANTDLKLAGAVYGVYSDDAATKLVQTLAATNGSGIAVSGELPFGQNTVYYVKEITPPAGYELNTQVQQARFTQPGQVVDLTFANTKTIIIIPNGSLVIKKVDSLDATKTLAGATFALYADEALKNPAGAPVTTGADGLARWDNLAAGAYWIVETAAPANYDRLTSSIPVTVTAGVTNPGPIVIKNQYNPPEEIQSGSLIIKKVDSLTPTKALKGATFALYADEALKSPAGAPVTTGADGLARWDGLDAGTYWVVETAAPENYDLMKTPLEVTVTAGVDSPDPVVIMDQYNPPEDIQTGMMDWNILLMGALALASGLVLFMLGRKKPKHNR